jgi:hypothetical protein
VLYAIRLATATLCRRVQAIEAEAARIDEHLVTLVAAAAPSLLETLGVGPDATPSDQSGLAQLRYAQIAGRADRTHAPWGCVDRRQGHVAMRELGVGGGT